MGGAPLTVDGLLRGAIYVPVSMDLQVVAVPGRGCVQVGECWPQLEPSSGELLG